jgi:anaerobic magnesium-protoporphyrin IX monomethyl ester cyclase
MVRGISFRVGDEVVQTPERDVIPTAGVRALCESPPVAATLDSYRVGWELIEDWDLYQCFGLGRAAIVQFSRGCPHRCTYCGQHGFWSKWRHRDPVRVADEIAWLARERGVRFVTLADENPTTNKALWRKLLEELAARRTGVQLFATIRATDIVRDADMLDLYKRAGILYVLLGIDTTDPEIQVRVNKRSTMAVDGEACRLLRRHGIRSIAAHIVGLGDETWADFRRARRVLSAYDADLLNVMYATPHSWSKFAEESAGRLLVQEDQSKWDYRHQVLGQRRMSPSGLFAAVKWLELVHHLHPKRLPRLVWCADGAMRRQFWWTQWRIGRVWVGEVWEFLVGVRFARRPGRLGEWLKRNRVEEKREERVQVTVSRGTARVG